MAEPEYEPLVRDHQAFLHLARRRRGFQKAYEALEVEYQVARALRRVTSPGHCATLEPA